jgi:hypothetical protein
VAVEAAVVLVLVVAALATPKLPPATPIAIAPTMRDFGTFISVLLSVGIGAASHPRLRRP